VPPSPLPADVPPDDRRMSIFDHLEELRKRLFYATAYWLLCSAVAGWYAEGLMGVVLEPFLEALEATGQAPRMIYTDPTASFTVGFRVVLILGAFLAAPFVFWEIWGFVAAGLYGRERRMVLALAPFSWLLFLGGVVFFHLWVLPSAVTFLFSYGRDLFPARPEWEVIQLPDVGASISFYLWMALSMGLVFQLPLVMWILNALGAVSAGGFLRYQRHFILGATIAAALITPTGDAVTLALFTIPILALFYLGVLAAWIRERSTR
jgi:sec-independent protein translocase protein TatC